MRSAAHLADNTRHAPTLGAFAGQTPTPELLDSYMATALDVSASRQGSAAASQVKGINFTQFLTMFGEHLAEVSGRADVVVFVARGLWGDKWTVVENGRCNDRVS